MATAISSMTMVPLLGNLQLWLTPIWMLSVGVLSGAALLAILYGIVWVISRESARSIPRIIQESVLLPAFYLLIALAGFAVVAAPTMPSRNMWSSLQRLPHVGPQTVNVAVPARTDDQEVDLEFRADELQRYAFMSEQDLVIGVEPGKAYSDPLVLVEGDEPYLWTPSSKSSRLFDGTVTKLFITNESDAETDLTIEVTTDVEMPEVHHIPVVAGCVVGLFAGYVLLYWLLPGVSAIALTTAKEAVAQPLFLLSLMIGAFAIMAFVYVPYNTFGEDVKVLRNTGFETIMVLAVMVALWTASTSVADEIEGRTALTLLSKPISRRQFVLGKFLGIILPVLLLFILLGIWLMGWVSFKVVYDARETSNPNPDWQLCYDEMVRVVPGLVLSFFEAVVLAAIAVAISTRLPFVPNLIICGTIYLLGHLGTRIVQSSALQLEFVAFIGKLVAVVVPVLDHFNIQAAVAGGQDVPPAYLAWALLYCALYCAAMMLLALILFEDRDLA